MFIIARLLIADDSSIARKLLKRILLALNHEIVAEVEDGEQAVIEYEKHLPDIVAIDMDMPVMDGLEATKKIMKKHPDAKIIIISAHEKNDLNELARKNNLEYVINKPITQEKLSEQINKLLSNSNAKYFSEEEIQNILGLKTEDIVSVSHYSGLHPFKSIVTGITRNTITIKLSKEFFINNLLQDDPIVIGYEQDNKCFIYGCTIKLIDNSNKFIVINVDVIESTTNKRENERFPVSLYIDIKDDNGKNNCIAIVKNISTNGMCINTKADFLVGNKVNFDVFLHDKVLSLDAEIVRKVDTGKYFEYGLRLFFKDYKVLKFFEKYVETLKSEQEKVILKLKESRISLV